MKGPLDWSKVAPLANVRSSLELPLSDSDLPSRHVCGPRPLRLLLGDRGTVLDGP